MITNPFETQLERLARTLTDQFGVQVLCQGDQAYTDGRRIVLPSLPDPMDEPLERMIVGFLDHEMGHVAFSDFDVIRRFNTEHPAYRAMLNVVEDALVERLAMQRWPGVRANLDTMFAQIQSRVRRQLPTRSPFDRFATAVYLKLSHHSALLGLKTELAGYEDLLETFDQVHDTAGAATLAENLLTRWLSRHPPNEGSAQAQAQPKGEEQSSGDASKPGDSQAQRPPTATESIPGAPEPAGEHSSHRGLPPSQPNRCGGDSHGQSMLEEVLVQAITRSVARIDPSRQYRPFTTQYDRVEPVPTAKPAEVDALMATGTDVIRRLRRGLANILRSAEKRWWRDDQLRGQLSPRRLYRLGMDRPRLDVFRTRAVVQGQSTAVCVLLDASGSMHSRKMAVARESLRVLLEALGDLKIPTEALTFTTGSAHGVDAAAATTGMSKRRLVERYARFSSLQIGLVKTYSQPIKVGLARLPAIHGTGLTPLGEAMQVAAKRIAFRSENRRIMLVLTDGRAGCECNSDAAMAHAMHIAGRIKQAGIELIGVGIQDDSVCQIVADSIVVHELSDLPGQLCKLLGRTLKKGMRHVG